MRSDARGSCAALSNPERRMRRRVLWGVFTVLGITAISLTAAAATLIASDAYRNSGAWRAELSLRDFECSRGLVCRMRTTGRIQRATAGNGQPFEFRINALGFRGADVPVQRADPRTLRVEVFGDSLAFGLGVNDGETFGDQLGAELRRAFPGRPVEVLNFALPMNYLASNARNYREYGRAYTPDAVVFTNTFNINPRDINYRVIQIRSSPLLTTALTFDVGRTLVNDWQRAMMSRFDRGEASALLRELFQPVLEDQVARGMKLVFFNFLDVAETPPTTWAPPALQHVDVDAGMRVPEYRASAYAIPGDGHPTPEGHRYFAHRVAAALVPQLAGSPAHGP